MQSEINNKAFKSGLWYTFSNFLLRAIGFITIPLFSRLLSQEDFGIFSNFSSWQSIFGIIVSMNLTASLITAKYDYSNKFDEYVFSMCILDTISASLWLILIIVFPSQISFLLGLKTKYIFFLIFYLYASSIFNLFQCKEQFLYKYKWNVTLALLNSLTSTLFSLLLVIILPNKLDGRIYGFVYPTIIIGMILLLFLGIKAKWKYNRKTWKYALKICLPFIPHSLSLVLLSAMDKVMITRMCGATDTAIYSLAYMCGAIITLLISSMNSAYAPWLGDQLFSNKIKEIRNMSYYYVGAFIIMAFGLMLFTPEILLIMGGRKYYTAKYVMAPVSLGIIFQFLYTMFVNVEQFKKKTIPMAVATVCAAIMNYLLNIIFIKNYGYIAAAYTTAVSYLFLLISHMYIVYKMNGKDIYNYGFILFIVMLSSFSSLIIGKLYSYDFYRYFLIIIYISLFLFLIYCNRSLIKKFYLQTKRRK